MKKRKPKPQSKADDMSPDAKLVDNLWQALEKLEARAATGSKEAKVQLAYFRRRTFRDLQKDLEQKAKAGEITSPPPIGTILEMADFAIPLLLWLSEHQRENIKTYARHRWAWPGYFHLTKREDKKYQALLPKFDKAGKEITKNSPIELGKSLGLKINANLTMADRLFQIAAYAVREVVQLNANGTRFWGNSWLWLRAHHKPFEKLKGEKYHRAVDAFLLSLGDFSKSNWPKWKPVFETFLTLQFAPPEIRFEIMPKEFRSNLSIALDTGTHMQWFEQYRKSHRMTAVQETQFMADLNKEILPDFVSSTLQEVANPKILEIVSLKKTKRGQWNELRDEILKRIERMAPAP